MLADNIKVRAPGLRQVRVHCSVPHARSPSVLSQSLGGCRNIIRGVQQDSVRLRQGYGLGLLLVQTRGCRHMSADTWVQTRECRPYSGVIREGAAPGLITSSATVRGELGNIEVHGARLSSACCQSEAAHQKLLVCLQGVHLERRALACKA